MTDTPHISARSLSVHYPLGRRLFGQAPVVKAIDNVTLDHAAARLAEKRSKKS